MISVSIENTEFLNRNYSHQEHLGRLLMSGLTRPYIFWNVTCLSSLSRSLRETGSPKEFSQPIFGAILRMALEDTRNQFRLSYQGFLREMIQWLDHEKTFDIYNQIDEDSVILNSDRLFEEAHFSAIITTLVKSLSEIGVSNHELRMILSNITETNSYQKKKDFYL